MKKRFVLLFILAMASVILPSGNLLSAAPATKRAPVNLTARALTPEASSRKLMELVISKDYQQCMNFKKRGETCVKMTEPEYFALLSRSFVFFSDMKSWAKKNSSYKDDNAYRNGILEMMKTLRDAAAGRDPTAAHKLVGTMYSGEHDLVANAFLYGDLVNANTLGLGRVDIRDVTKLINLKYIIAKYQHLNMSQIAALKNYISPAKGNGSIGNASADKTSDGPTPTNDTGSTPTDVMGCFKQAMSLTGSFTTPPGAAKPFMPTDPNTGGSFGLTGAPTSGPGSGNITISGEDPCLGTDFSKMPGYGVGEPGFTTTKDSNGNTIRTSNVEPCCGGTTSSRYVYVDDSDGHIWSAVKIINYPIVATSLCDGHCVDSSTAFPPPKKDANGNQVSSYTSSDGTVTTITVAPDGSSKTTVTKPDGTTTTTEAKAPETTDQTSTDGGDESTTGMANQYSDNSPVKSKCGSTVTYCSLNGGGSDSSGGNSGSDSNCSAAKSGFNKDAPPEGPFGCGGGDPTLVAQQRLMVIDWSPEQLHELIQASINSGAAKTTTIRQMVNQILK